MAKVRRNIVIEGISGPLGEQLVIKVGKSGQTVIATTPKFPENRQFSDAQAAQQQKFGEAVKVVLATDQDQLIEQGTASPDEGLWWKYVTTTNAPSADVKIVVHAWDLPGHETVQQAE